MAVPVNIYVETEDVVPTVLTGVAVAIFDQALQLMGQELTDDAGKASFLLPGGTYEVRLFKSGVRFQNPRQIIVVEPEDPQSPNGFTVTGTPVGVFGIPIDPRLCRCVGRFVNYQNMPMANAMVRIASEADVHAKMPKIVDNAMVASSAMEFRTDQNGFVVLDLFRTGKYWITFSGEEDEVWDFNVPDRDSANLIDLIHPQPVSLAYDQVAAPANVVTVHIGEVGLVPYSLLMSDYQEHSRDLDLIEFTVSDPLLADVTNQTNVGQLSITGKSGGELDITVSVKEGLHPYRLPAYGVAAPSLHVIVIP